MIDRFDPRQLRDSERLIHVSFKSRTVFDCTCSTPQTAEIHRNPFCPQLRKSITKHLVVSTATHLEDSNSTTPAPWTSRIFKAQWYLELNQDESSTRRKKQASTHHTTFSFPSMYVPANDNKPTKWHLIVGTQTRHSRNETEAWSQANAEVCHDYMNFSKDLWRSLGSLGSAKQRASKYGWTCGAVMHYASRYNFQTLTRTRDTSR